MKKIIYILFAALLSASCSGELDIPSEMSLSANQELNSSDVDKLLNGLYASTVNPSGYGYFSGFRFSMRMSIKFLPMIS